jgi:hypothetical protein
MQEGKEAGRLKEEGELGLISKFKVTIFSCWRK